MFHLHIWLLEALEKRDDSTVLTVKELKELIYDALKTWYEQKE